MNITTKESFVVSEKVAVRVNVYVEDETIQFVFPKLGTLGITKAIKAAKMLREASDALVHAALETQAELYGN